MTARNIAAAVGLTSGDPVVIEGRSLRPVADLSVSDLQNLLAADVFARVSSAQKLDLITL